MTSKQSGTQSGKLSASISQVLGASTPLLPGESQDEYQQGLDAVIEELQARTPMQVYIAQKIFDCLWWIRRYEQHKTNTLVVTMAKCITQFHVGDGLSGQQAQIVSALRKNEWNNRTLKEHMSAYNHTPQTMLQEATNRVSSELADMDQQIALRIKTMSGLQSAYEALVNRRIISERLRLQTELLRRDLTAIELPAIEASPSSK